MPDDSKRPEVLICSACGAAVPLGAKDRFACVHCGQEIIPGPEHLALRDAVDKDVDARRRAEALARRITAASPLLIALGRFVREGGYTLIGIVFAAIGALVSMFFLFELQSFCLHTLHVDMMDVMRQGEYMALFAFVVAIFVGALPVTASFGLRFAEGRARLLLGLAARPPKSSKDTEQCRLCGAPLSSPDLDALFARCHYCGADNLLCISRDRFNAKVKLTKELSASIEAAEAAHLREQSKVRRTFLFRLGLVLLPVALTYVLFSLGDGEGRPNWRDAVESNRLWMPVYVDKVSLDKMSLSYPCIAQEEITVLAALRHKETLRALITSEGKPPAVIVEALSEKIPLTDERGGPLIFEAPHSGWFAIIVKPSVCKLGNFETSVTVRFEMKL